MHERDLQAEEAFARSHVDQVGAGLGQLSKSGPDVGDLIGDVVHARPALGEKAADRRVLAERLEQLDAPLPDPHGDGMDSLGLDGRAVLDVRAEEALVRRECLVEILDGDAEMVDAARPHGREATGPTIPQLR